MVSYRNTRMYQTLTFTRRCFGNGSWGRCAVRAGCHSLTTYYLLLITYYLLLTTLLTTYCPRWLPFAPCHCVALNHRLAILPPFLRRLLTPQLCAAGSARPHSEWERPGFSVLVFTQKRRVWAAGRHTPRVCTL